MKMPYIQYLIIIVVLLIIALVIIKANRKDFHIEANKLVEYLGGKENIISIEVNMSRFKVTLKNVSIVNKDAIQKLGARGIVEIDNQLKIILGSEGQKLKKYIEDLKK
jgi:PTS system N-acetylglucosamine-specific IIC component